MSEKKIKLTTIKIALLGDKEVGKSSICNALEGIEFNDNRITTIGYDKIEKMSKSKNGSEIKVIIFDTDGQERFYFIVFPLIRNIHGLIIVFDITKRNSFNNIDLWLKEIGERFLEPSMVLFGNKADIEKNEWKVTEDEIQKKSRTI